MKKGFFREGLTGWQKVLGVLFLSSVVLFFVSGILMFVGLIGGNRTVMWIGVAGAAVCMLGILKIKIK